MAIRAFVFVIIAVCLFGIAIGFLWLWSGLPTDTPYRSGDVTIEIFPSIYAVWIPLIYLFFTSVWAYLLSKQADESFRFFLRFDAYTYSAVLIFFLLQMLWKHLGLSAFWFRSFVFALIAIKGVLLFRAIYKFPQVIHPILLVVLSNGIYLLLFPFTYIPFSASVIDLLQHAMLMQIGVVLIKSVCISFMALEMFRLSVAMTNSVQSAFFSWFIFLFTFPIVGLPKIVYLLAGLLLIFILRLVFSRLDTKDLMLGLLTPTNITMLIKLFVIVMILGVAGLVYWGNVKPGFRIYGGRALQAAISALFDGQFGLGCYAPIYWLAFLGICYLIFFKVWDGLLLIMTGGILYGGYFLAMYGMLVSVTGQNDIVPFLPILGIFIAVAHDRFGKMALFRFGTWFLVMFTGGLTFLFMASNPDFVLIASKFAEIQRNVIDALNRDLMYIAPSSVFHPYPLSLFIWLGVMTIIALLYCNVRTRAFHTMVKKASDFVNQHRYVQQISLPPVLLLIILLSSSVVLRYSNIRHSLPMNQPILLSPLHYQKELIIADEELTPLDSKGILIVSNVTVGGTVPHQHTLANVTVFDQEQRFETFTLKAGRDTSEVALEKREVKAIVAHGRAAIYRSWSVKAEDNTSFEAHEYYTRLVFSKPMNVQKIVFKFFDPQQENLFPDMALHIQKIALLN